jgi:hypothetical protein
VAGSPLRCVRAPLLRTCLQHRLASVAAAMPGGTDWLARGSQWAKWDPNSETASEIAGLVERGDTAELALRLGSRLTFGTAGIRGPMGSGSLCMNELTVIQTTQGLLKYLEIEMAGDATTGATSAANGAALLRERGVCIGYDHRRRGTLHSGRFALLAATVFVSRGVPVMLYGKMVPTPLVPWCVEQEGCAAGIMLTASHNPKEDNGYKVYWRTGHQITAPHDTGIVSATTRASLIHRHLRRFCGEWGKFSLTDLAVPAYVRTRPAASMTSWSRGMPWHTLTLTASASTHSAQTARRLSKPLTFPPSPSVSAASANTTQPRRLWSTRPCMGWGRRLWPRRSKRSVCHPIFQRWSSASRTPHSRRYLIINTTLLLGRSTRLAIHHMVEWTHKSSLFDLCFLFD